MIVPSGLRHVLGGQRQLQVETTEPYLYLQRFEDPETNGLVFSRMLWQESKAFESLENL